MGTPTEITIKETEMPQRRLVIVTTQLSKPHLLRPFVLTVKDTSRGTASAVGSFTCESSAVRAHDALVRRLWIVSAAPAAATEGQQAGDSP